MTLGERQAKNTTGLPAAATNFAVGSFPRSVAVGDFNGDGQPDLAVANYTNNNNVHVLLNITAAQAITFAALADKTFGDAPFTVSASATSSLAVSFSIVSGPAG